ncbi:hypothetical protein Tsubulata_005086 [Turnera subulata]|uniref:histone acetyltransferase n=1 Tax=Turnera subulata TaxID=218843 RepID=A0A9Q0FKP3_9ROSI|nr:hypothetical protein Tsubulata_005086 [Turnera subulata]
MLSRGYILGGNALQRYPPNDFFSTLTTSWRNDPRIGCFRDLVRKRIAEVFESVGNWEWKLRGYDFVIELENQLFTEAASEEEYMNQDTLRQRLQLLIQAKMADVNCGLASIYPLPSSTVMETLGLTQGCSSVAPEVPFHPFNYNVSDYNPMVLNNNSNQFGFCKGLLDNQYEPVFSGVNTSSYVGTGQIANDMVLSPELTSTITACSGGSEIGGSYSGPVFSHGDRGYNFETSFKDSFQQQYLDNGTSSPVNFQGVGDDMNLNGMALTSTLKENSELSGSEVSSVLPDGGIMDSFANFPQSKSQMLEESQSQLHGLFNKLSEPESSFFSQQNNFCFPIAGQSFSIDSQLPPEYPLGVHLHSGGTLPNFSSKECDKKKNPTDSQLSMECKVLSAYIKHKQLVPQRGGNLNLFINHLHSTVCNNCKCMCASYRSLLSHYDQCPTGCPTCNPLLDKFITNQLQPNVGSMRNVLVRNFTDMTSGGLGSSCSENTTPPKRPKMETSSGPISSQNKISSALASVKVQSRYSDRLPALQQWPESPISVNSEVVEARNELLQNPMRTYSSVDGVISNNMDNDTKLNGEGACGPSEELIGCSKPVEADSRTSCKFDGAQNSASNQLTPGDVPNDTKLNAFEEEMIQGKASSELARPDIDDQLNVPAIEHKEGTKPSTKTRSVSLIDFFTAEQIREHLSSLGQWIGQRTKVERGNQMLTDADKNSCQLCTADRLLLDTVPVYCSSCGARIKRGVIYYSISEKNDQQPCLCAACFKLARCKITFLGTDIPKSKMKKRKNDVATEEAWVQCNRCEQWQHQICALFNDKRDREQEAEYICPKCCLEDIESGVMSLSKDSAFSAKDLPTTKLSDLIEQRLFKHLQQEREERAKALGMNLDQVPRAEDLAVRVVSSVDKNLKVKKQLLEIFHGEKYPAELPYRSKAILLFQKIEGVDVCIFSMYVQEFGAECSQPNQRCVYISYLDSVKYFRPEIQTAAGEALRTFVYHEILIGYLECCKKRGFATCYLWACPPLKGEDYILNCHPEIQKTPKSDKLRQWYHSMLKKAAKENVVVSFTNLYDHFFVPTGECFSKVTAARLPYFDGYYWSDAAENVIKNIEQNSEENSGRHVKKVMTKRTLKAMGHTNPSDAATKDILLMQKLGQTICPVKEDFIVVHLQFVCSHCREAILSGWRWFCSQCKNFQLCERCHDMERSLRGEDIHILNMREKHFLSKVMVDVPSETTDIDGTLDSVLFENRHSFLSFCQKNHYQFDTLRRAKHSSMMILYHLHNPATVNDVTACNICHQETGTQDTGVCSKCQQKNYGSLPVHKSIQCSLAANGGTLIKKKAQAATWKNELLDALQHASHCLLESCSYEHCLKIRRMFFHTKDCATRVSGGCQVCEKVWSTLMLHSRNCSQEGCHIPRCEDLKQHPRFCRSS